MQNESGIVRQTWWTLRLTYGLVPIVAGLDKFFNLLTDWSQYLSPVARNVLPFGPETFMMIVGVIEIAAGVLVLTKFTRIGAFVVSAWLVAIALNLISTGQYFDIAVRDLVMAVGAAMLGRLSAVVGHETERKGYPATSVTTGRRVEAHP